MIIRIFKLIGIVVLLAVIVGCLGPILNNLFGMDAVFIMICMAITSLPFIMIWIFPELWTIK
jgi:hypothetical protein